MNRPPPPSTEKPAAAASEAAAGSSAPVSAAVSAEPERQGFLARWSRRKAEVREAQSSQAPHPKADSAAARVEPPAAQPSQGDSPSTPGQPRPPTLADVEQLTAQSDFSLFASRDVDPEVRNAAMRKLFHAEPQFNVMDGLDVYIDDYNTPDPLPKAIMRTMLQARALGLLDDELKEQELPAARAASADGEPLDTPTDTDTDTVQPAPAASENPLHEDPDLQLQPHDAAGRASAEEGAEPCAQPPVDAQGGESGRQPS